MAKEFLTVAENVVEINNIRSSFTKEDLINLETIVVHGDTFHLDDSTFVAELLEAREEFGCKTQPDVIRARRNEVNLIIENLQKEGKRFVVGDIMNGTFDHHDLMVCRYPNDANLNIVDRNDALVAKRKAEPYTASSKMWMCIGPMILNDSFTEKIDDEFFRMLDANDNFGSIVTAYGKVSNPLSIAVKRMNPNINEIKDMHKNDNISEEELNRIIQHEQDLAFNRAVDFIRAILHNMICSYKGQMKAYEMNHIAEIEAVANTPIISIDKYIAANLFDPKKINYIVEPASTPGWWQVTTTDSESYPIIERKDLSDDIKCELDEYDSKVDAGEIQTQKVFFHKTGFLAVIPKKEWAIAIANASVNRSR